MLLGEKLCWYIWCNKNFLLIADPFRFDSYAHRDPFRFLKYIDSFIRTSYAKYNFWILILIAMIQCHEIMYNLKKNLLNVPLLKLPNVNWSYQSSIEIACTYYVGTFSPTVEWFKILKFHWKNFFSFPLKNLVNIFLHLSKTNLEFGSVTGVNYCLYVTLPTFLVVCLWNRTFCLGCNLHLA